MSLMSMLKRQRKQERATESETEFKDPLEDPTSIGNILMNQMGKITKSQLNQAVDRKAATDDLLLGAFLKDMGLINNHDVARALKIQADMRSGDKVEAAFCTLEARLDEAIEEANRLTATVRRVQTKRKATGELRLVLPDPVTAMSGSKR